MSSNRRLSQIIISFWAANAILAVGASIVWFLNTTKMPVTLPTATLASAPTQTTLPVPTSKPSITPSPSPTFTPDNTETPTLTQFDEEPLIIGSSVAGRPLEVYRFGTGLIIRMIVAGIHGGNEWNTIALADELIGYLQDHPEMVPTDVTLYILHNLNPDGEARAHGVEGRANDHGVDLNRNWPFRWQKTWDRTGCWASLPVTAGDYPASEPETASLLAFIQTHDIDALISYHSAALGIFAGGVPPYEPSTRLAETVASVTTYPYPAIDTGCDYTGNLTDWAATQDIAAVDIELTNHTGTDFDQNLKVLHVFLNWKR